MKIWPMGSDFFHAEKQTEKQTWTKLRDAFHNFVNSPHNFSNATSDNKFYSQSTLLMKLHGKNSKLK